MALLENSKREIALGANVRIFCDARRRLFSFRLLEHVLCSRRDLSDDLNETWNQSLRYFDGDENSASSTSRFVIHCLSRVMQIDLFRKGSFVINRRS